MALKKSDKLIAIIGVIILIIAGIGIAIYSMSGEESETPKAPKEKEIEYMIYDDVEQSSSESNTFTVKKGLLLISKAKLAETELFTVDGDNVKKVMFNITYSDNNAPGLLKFLSSDVLTITITDPDMNTYDVSIAGEDNVMIEIDVNDMIDTSPIYASSLTEAELELENRSLTKWKGESFMVSATLKVKGIFRPLRRLAERLGKDTFTIESMQESYVYTLETSETPPTQQEMSQPQGPIYSSTNFVGMH